MAARAYMYRKVQGWTNDREGDEAETRRLAQRVAAIGQDDALALSWAGHALAFVCREFEIGAAFADQALSLNPNLAEIVASRGNISSYLGQHEEAIEHFMHALRLGPLDPEIYRVEAGLAIAMMLLGRYREAIDWSTRSLARQPNWARSLRTAAAAHALEGNLEEARRAMRQLLELYPGLRMSALPHLLPYRTPKDMATWTEGLRLAGLPE
jgi:tetratricopeptide (TPR) repeat protein